jgi:hypothetical protein
VSVTRDSAAWADNRWVNLAGHYAIHTLTGLFLAYAPLHAATAAGLLDPDGATSNLRAAMSATFVAAFLAQRVHDAHLCARCIAAWPLDGSDTALRKRRWLRLYHLPSEVLGPRTRGKVAALLAAVVAVGIVGLLIPQQVNYAGAAALDLLIAALNYATLLHHRLDAWCPWCRRDDGGGVHEPTPDPSARIPA